LLSLVAASCGPKGSTQPLLSAEPLVVFPSPPDTTRIQFLTRFGSSLDIVEQRPTSFWQTLIGETEEAEKGKPILKPYGIALHAGKIYVCDTALGGIEVIDLESHSFEYFQPRGLGQLQKPINCFVDGDDGRLYVADVERGQVVVFDTSGRYVNSFGTEEGMRPTDVFVDEAGIWVCDIAGQRVRVYDKNTFLLSATYPNTEPDEPGHLYNPTNIFVTPDRLYVSDFGDFKVKVYTRDGEYLSSVGSYGTSLGQFARPKGIAVDSNHNLYVVDAGFENVQLFDRDGKLLMFFGGPYEGPGYMWLPAKVIIDYENLEYFQQFVHDSFVLKYLVLVTNQYGPDKISVYGFVEPRQTIAGH
jgi:DNA-binding beta-propeller fold protein YncE